MDTNNCNELYKLAKSPTYAPQGVYIYKQQDELIIGLAWIIAFVYTNYTVECK